MPCARSSLAQSASSLAVRHQASGTRQTSKRMSGSWIRSKDSRPGRVRKQRQGQKVLVICIVESCSMAQLGLCCDQQISILCCRACTLLNAGPSSPLPECHVRETRRDTVRCRGVRMPCLCTADETLTGSRRVPRCHFCRLGLLPIAAWGWSAVRDRGRHQYTVYQLNTFKHVQKTCDSGTDEVEEALSVCMRI